MPSASVAVTDLERTAARPGDDVVPDASVVMDRAFTVDAPVPAVWPWFVQLGKQRAGWYLPRWVERFVPHDRRAYRVIEPGLQELAVGDVIPDWGGNDATFTVARLSPPHTVVHVSTRGHVRLSWSITLTERAPGVTRVHLRLRLGGVKHARVASVVGGAFDWLTVVGLAAGLRERVGR